MEEPPISKVFVFTSFVSAVLSITIIFVGLWLRQNSSALDQISTKVIIYGCCLLIISIMGMLAACGIHRRKRFFIVKLNLFCTFILIVGLAFLVYFIHTVVSADVAISYAPPSRAYMEYKLVESSSWLGKKVSEISWNRFKEYVTKSSICNDLTQSYDSAENFFKANLSPLQSGCCKPPTLCGYNFVTPTNWISPTNSSADPDCDNWKNQPFELCYDCSSCKAGFCFSVQETWGTANKFLISSLVLLILAWVFGIVFVSKRKRSFMEHQHQQSYT